jgi:hypothetical protein
MYGCDKYILAVLRGDELPAILGDTKRWAQKVLRGRRAVIRAVRGPSPNTVCVANSQRGHPRQHFAASRKSASECELGIYDSADQDPAARAEARVITGETSSGRLISEGAPAAAANLRF